MRAKRIIPAAVILIIVTGIFLFLNKTKTSFPALVLVGYQRSTNNYAIANLEFRNTSGRTIWLSYIGHTFLERPVVPPKATIGLWASVYGLHDWAAEKVVPGDSLRLEYPLRSGEPAKHVGIIYYFGKFSDANDFLNHLLRPLPSITNWKDKAVFLATIQG